ncbi:unnamed protein product [Brugia pahangi]|uniref:Uncharacterized protein n=1 Tax=Brugia pahangi TaxID=6280 RepID=A0A0N4SWY0_BRUPA|nr:unnamed protein product [Brugia pahangi]
MAAAQTTVLSHSILAQNHPLLSLNQMLPSQGKFTRQLMRTSYRQVHLIR